MAGQVAQGMTLGVNAGGTLTTYTSIAEIVSIDGPNQERDDIDTTHLTSANNTKEFKPGLTDPGEVELELNFLPNDTTQDQLRAEMYSATVKGWKITFADASTTTCIFQGYLKAYGHSGESSGKMEGSATIKVAGQPTYS